MNRFGWSKGTWNWQYWKISNNHWRYPRRVALGPRWNLPDNVDPGSFKVHKQQTSFIPPTASRLRSYHQNHDTLDTNNGETKHDLGSASLSSGSCVSSSWIIREFSSVVFSCIMKKSFCMLICWFRFRVALKMSSQNCWHNPWNSATFYSS